MVDDICVWSASGADFLARDIVLVTGPDRGGDAGGMLDAVVVGASVANVRRAVQTTLRLSRGLANLRVVLDILLSCYVTLCYAVGQGYCPHFSGDVLQVVDHVSITLMILKSTHSKRSLLERDSNL